MVVDTTVDIGGITIKNPIMTASGTYGYGYEFAPYVDLSSLGGILVKGTTFAPRQGNPYPRSVETPSGMLNAVGLQNKGVHYFVDHIYPEISQLGTEIIVNVNGSTIDDYVRCVEVLNGIDTIRMIEVNISCPNVKEGGMAFGVTPKGATSVVDAVRKATNKKIMVKLSPNVTDIREIALAVEGAGADAISMINTMLGMAIDHKTRRPLLSTITGGLSGPCVKPIALRMVWQTAQVVKVPIIGMGGISSLEDVLQFLIAGASAVQVGTYNFVNPAITGQLVKELNQYLQENNITDVRSLIGSLEV